MARNRQENPYPFGVRLDVQKFKINSGNQSEILFDSATDQVNFTLLRNIPFWYMKGNGVGAVVGYESPKQAADQLKHLNEMVEKHKNT